MICIAWNFSGYPSNRVERQAWKQGVSTAIKLPTRVPIVTDGGYAHVLEPRCLRGCSNFFYDLGAHPSVQFIFSSTLLWMFTFV